MLLLDTHMHLIPSIQTIQQTELFNDNFTHVICTCAHSKDEYIKQEKFIKELSNSKQYFLSCFGIHPQAPNVNEEEFLYSLLEEKKIAAIGETGFDLFTKKFKETQNQQEEVWKFQCECSVEFSIPIIIHNRKALDNIFRDIKLLKKVPAVIFHSFGFGEREAESILKHNINAYFSFGKQILNGNKKSIACVTNLSEDRILFETDSPYQTLKGESFTVPMDILSVYKEAAILRNVEIEELSNSCKANIQKIFPQTKEFLLSL